MIVDNFANLETRFGLRHRFNPPSYLDDYFFRDDRKLLLIDGSLHLEQSLRLDWSELDKLAPGNPPLHGLFVLGDLTIEGGLLNANMDGGPVLFVAGNLVAHNLLAGGADICINRDVSVRDIVFSNYNHGALYLYGNLHAGLLVMHDHLHHFGRNLALHKSDEDSFSYSQDGSEEEHLQELRSILDLDLSRAEEVSEALSELREALAEDHEVLKPSARNTRTLAPARFPATKAEILDFIARHEIVRSEVIPAAMKQDRAFMLQLSALHPGVYRFLPNGWHLEPDFMHAALDAGNSDVASYLQYVHDDAQRARLQDRLASASE